jgi:hypothetical protein
MKSGIHFLFLGLDVYFWIVVKALYEKLGPIKSVNKVWTGKLAIHEMIIFDFVDLHQKKKFKLYRIFVNFFQNE